LLSADADVCDRAKILVLGDCPESEVADLLELDQRVLTAWEALFFDVRDNRQASDQVLAQVIAPEQRGGNAHLAAMMKFAHAGGSVAARAILKAESRVKLQQGVTLFDKKILLNLKLDEAMSLSLDTERSRLFFVRHHAELLEKERRLHLQERKLELRCQEALQKEAQAEARLERARRHNEERTARQAEKQARQARKEEQQRLQRVEEQVRTTAWLQARSERKRRAQEQASRSLLAQLRWNTSAEEVSSGGS
jgi:hypothetical protein